MYKIKFSKNYGGPLHYLGNRYLTLPDQTGHMKPDDSWLMDIFTIILSNARKGKYTTCYEPFAGSAAWSLAAMELGLAEKYVINDSDSVLIKIQQVIKKMPVVIKEKYASLLDQWNTAASKNDLFIRIINDYNEANIENKSHLLPFIINHSWSGILFHDRHGNIILPENHDDENSFTRYLDESNLSYNEFCFEVDRVSNLLSANDVTFKSGDFEEPLTEVANDDFVTLNPPYPENTRSITDKTGMYQELYSPDKLHDKLLKLINRLDANDVHYFMTYGFYNPKMINFVVMDRDNHRKNYFRLLGYENCAFGRALDQMYFNPRFLMPDILKNKITKAEKVLRERHLSPEEALKEFLKLSEEIIIGCNK